MDVEISCVHRCFCDGRGEHEAGDFTRPFPFQVWTAKNPSPCHHAPKQEYNNTTGKFVYNSNNVAQLDLVISEAKRAGLRIICALGNNWEQFGYDVITLFADDARHTTCLSVASGTT